MPKILQSSKSKHLVYETINSINSPVKRRATVFRAHEYELYENDYEYIKNVYKDQDDVEINFLLCSYSDKYQRSLGYHDIANVVYWENFFLYMMASEIETHHYNPNHNIDKLFITMINKSVDHRCYLLDQLARFKLLNKHGFHTYHEWNDGYQFEYWKQEITTLDRFLRGEGETNQYRLPNEMNRVLFDIIAETSVEHDFMTEKTWRPILIGKPFLVFGPPGFHAYLKSQGFELFEEFIDYDFDKQETHRIRGYRLLYQINQLKNYNYNEMMNTLKPKLRHNQEIAKNMIRNLHGIPDLAFDHEPYRLMIETAIKRLDSLPHP